MEYHNDGHPIYPGPDCSDEEFQEWLRLTSEAHRGWIDKLQLQIMSEGNLKLKPLPEMAL